MPGVFLSVGVSIRSARFAPLFLRWLIYGFRIRLAFSFVAIAASAQTLPHDARRVDSILGKIGHASIIDRRANLSERIGRR
ncbi:hypothetical protein ABID08_004281 [Rhizobium binae]|uniref:Uncharacterized protein n=1 Tax=Rhizobium binae TaxID=1138190 RepID=A0ABV2MKC3_9HYPH|nr:hypothetical protein [Rhizobium binae]MBX4962107.1 hypothetical protein [Rhizobium binae]MBX4991265.1 hypothetical protein [Rhizobium binae]NKL50445.1 hypothetical protein [Rhizobium leguminosarum bv. viciae]QSY81705.1 hypothetical protein J2J99_18975 [Rhizobium binae]